MSSINSKWSVASVFNPYGMLRFEENYEAHTARVQEGIHSSCSIYNIDYTIQRVVECIRRLGYSVNYGMCRETTKYVIHSIKCLKTKKFVYGTINEPYCWSEKMHLVWRNLAGNRSIYEKAKNFYPELFIDEYINIISDVSTIFTETKISELIENGQSKNKFIDNINLYLEGVSTIGNTLPSDIVEALRDFTSDDPNFVKEPWYEFHIPIPDSMACPVAEEIDKLSEVDSAVFDPHPCACLPEGAVNCKKNDCEYSSSSDSDDEC